MPDFGAPVADQVAPVTSGIQTLSALMGLKQQQLSIAQQQLGLQQQQQQLSSQTSQATQAAIHTKNIQALQGVDWRQFDTPNGYDIQAATDKAAQVGGVDAPDFASRLATMTQAGSVAKKSLLQLNQDYQQPVRDVFGLFGGDPNMKVSDVATQLEQISETAPPDQRAAIDKIMKSTFGLITGPNLFTGQPKTAQQQKAEALAYSRAGLPPSEVVGPGSLTAPTRGSATVKGQIVPTVSSPIGGGPEVSGAPLGPQFQITTLSSGQQGIVDVATGRTYPLRPTAGAPGGSPSTGGAPGGSAPPGTPTQSVGGAAPPANGAPGPSGSVRLTADTDPQRPGANAPTWRQQSYGALVQRGQHDVLAAQDADAGYGTNMETADMIRQYSNDAKTGPGTAGWTRIVGMIGSRFGAQNVADTQTLASFLDLQSSRLRDSMGLPATNAGLATSQEMGTSIESQRNAIQAKTDYYQALTQLSHEYRQGLDAAGNGGVNPSPSAISRFKSVFQGNADPVNAEIDLALRRGDTGAVKRIVSSLSPQQRTQLVKKRQSMNALMGSLGVSPNG